jgi:hypothetical protein
VSFSGDTLKVKCIPRDLAESRSSCKEWGINFGDPRKNETERVRSTPSKFQSVLDEQQMSHNEIFTGKNFK